MAKPIRIALLLLVIFSFVLGQENLEFDENGKMKSDSGTKTFALKKNGEFKKKYLHVTITSKSESKRNQYAIVSNSTQCETGRKLVGMAPYGPVNLIIPNDYLSESLYLCVQCTETNCNYEINLKAEDMAKFSIGEQYSYYIKDEKTKAMIFEFEVKSQQQPVNFRKLATVNTFHNIWVKAENLTGAHLMKPSSGFKEYSFEHGKIFHIKYSGTTNSYQLNVFGNIGDYINVGSIEINDKVASPLKVNDQEILSILTKDDDNSKEICFPTDKREDIKDENDVVYINGIAFTKKLKTYYREKIGGEIDEFSDKNITESNIIEGIYYGDYKSEKVYCVSFLEGDKKDHAIFSLQLSSNKYNFYSQFVYPPQYPGVIYPHFLLKNEIAVFRGMKPKQGASEINFNMKALMGFPDMLFDNCTTYPNCKYDDNKLHEINDPHHSNRMSVFSFYLKEAKEITPISQFQPLMIVKCREGPKYKNKTSDYCIFETTIFSNKDRLKLREVESISQFLLTNESDLYTVDFDGEEGVEKIYLDLLVFSGDVKFKIDDTDPDVDQAARKYFLANKIFYSIHVKDIKNNNKKQIHFSVIAQKNSFYIISYQLVKKEENNLNIRESGTNFVESIAVGEEEANHKLIYLQNFRSDVGAPFLASFYSKNCEFIISRVDDKEKPQIIERLGDFSQIVIDENDTYYHADKYTFNVSVITHDVSFYDRKVCMIYASGLELENKDTGLQRSISLSEGVPHSFLFSEKYYTISYAYHLSDLNNSVVIDINLIDKSTFLAYIYFDYYTYKNLTIFRNQQIFIYPSDLKAYCIKDEVCTINIVMKMQLDPNSKKLDKRVETTITQVNGSPIYLGKNVVRQDFLVGENEKLYYLDIGKEEQGDITINYKRGSGNIYVSIVKKTELMEKEGADWRGIYKFPKEIKDSLRYEPYLKKILILPEDTNKCDLGCYALITVKSSNLRNTNYTDEKDINIPYRITITPRIIQSGLAKYSEIPCVTIPMNEYIVGNIEISSGENLYYYYDIVLPFESEYLMIDWQADAPILLMNVGPENPSIDKNDYKFNCTEHDHVIIVPKQDIIDKCKNRSVELPNPDSLRHLKLTFAVYTKKVDTLYTSVYAFKLFMPPTYKGKDNKEKAAVELIHIRSDQKVQCDPGDFKTCLFAVIFDEGDISSHLIVHPRGQNEDATIKFMGDLVNSTEIERNNITYIVEKMPEMTGKYNSENGRNYIYIEKIPKDQCLLFIVESNINTIIEVLSSTSKDFFTIPNPSSPQIFALQSGNKLHLNFQTTQDLLINIVCVSGEGFFQWEEENVRKYHLFGKDDRITLTSGTNRTEDRLNSLVAESSTFNWYKSDNSGFVFYITYYPRNSEYNIDQVKPGRSTEFNYRDIKFPLHFFTPIKDNDITVSFNFYNFYSKEKEVNMAYNGPLFKIWGNIITAEEAYNARMDKQLKPDRNELSVNGTSDGPFGSLYFNYSLMEASKYDNKSKYALYFVVEMADKKPKYNFNGASMEVTILKEQTSLESGLFAPENVYINGKLSNNEILDIHYFRHRLRTDINNPYMLIEFSAISLDIKWFVSTYEFNETNIMDLPEMENKYKNGKRIIIFKVPYEKVVSDSLYLIVYNEKKNDTNKIDPKLANYVFKYMNGENKDSLFKFELPNSKVNYQGKNKTHELTFDMPFIPTEQESITYYVKGIYKKSMIKGERINSIAISESNGTYLQAFNTTPNNNSKISLKLENVPEELSCIKVLAKGTSNAINLYTLYDVVSVGKENCSINEDLLPGNKPSSSSPSSKGKKDDKKGISTPLIIGLSVGGGLILIISLIIIFICCCKGNKDDLKDKVNTISFTEPRDDDDLLASD